MLISSSLQRLVLQLYLVSCDWYMVVLAPSVYCIRGLQAHQRSPCSGSVSHGDNLPKTSELTISPPEPALLEQPCKWVLTYTPRPFIWITRVTDLTRALNRTRSCSQSTGNG